MGYRRRGLLKLVGGGIALSAAASALEHRRRDTASRAAVDDRQASAKDVVDQQAAPDDSGAPPAALSDRTDAVLDELAWFAGEYDAAVDSLQSAANAALEAVASHGEEIQLSDPVVARLDGQTDQPRLDRGWPYDVWWETGERRWRYVDVDWQQPSDEVTDETPLSSAAVSDLRDRTSAVADTFETELAPHFAGADAEASFATTTMDTIASFNDEGDIAMVVAGLVRLYEHYDALASPSYVERSLSDAPVRNRLADYLRSETGRSRTALFEVEYRRSSDRHRAFVYDATVDESRREELYRGEPLATIDGSTGATGGRRLQDVVSELSVSADRVDRCYVVVNEWDRPAERYYSAALTSQPLFVQRYDSAAAARDARDGLLDRSDISRAAVEVQLGAASPDAWTPIYFPHEGQPWSAALRQAGRHLFVVGVARRPFQHRDASWTAPLELAWVWQMA